MVIRGFLGAIQIKQSLEDFPKLQLLEKAHFSNSSLPYISLDKV
jgi:hypothetical protein